MSEDRNVIKTIKYFIQKNKLAFTLLSTLLVLLIIYLLIEVRVIFRPFFVILDVVLVPVIFAALFYYLFKPVRDWLEKKGVNRITAVFIVFLIIIVVIAVLIFSIMPFLYEQLTLFVTEFPANWNLFINSIDGFLEEYGLEQFQGGINDAITQFTLRITENIQNYLGRASSIITNAIGSVVNIVISFVTAPILLYYMLKEGEKLKPAVVKLAPKKVRNVFASFLSDTNKQLSLYIRGQILVAIGVAIMFLIGYNIIGLPYGSVLALVSGILNVIPYLGTFIAIVPAFIIAIVHSPVMVLYVLIVFTIEQTIEGRILSPKILGDNLEIHPITILIVLLVSGRLFGFSGIIIGVPLYAIIKVAAKYVHRYLTIHTDIY